jgi:hypothetical protein
VVSFFRLVFFGDCRTAGPADSELDPVDSSSEAGGVETWPVCTEARLSGGDWLISQVSWSA